MERYIKAAKQRHTIAQGYFNAMNYRDQDIIENYSSAME